MKPCTLLSDEPLLGLDDPTVEKIIENLKDPKLSYIIISQNKEFLRQTTTKVCTIEKGIMKYLDILK